MTVGTEDLEVLKQLDISKESAEKFDLTRSMSDPWVAFFGILENAVETSGLLIKANLQGGIYTIKTDGERKSIEVMLKEFSIEILGRKDSQEDAIKAERVYKSLKSSLSAIGVEFIGLENAVER